MSDHRETSGNHWNPWKLKQSQHEGSFLHAQGTVVEYENTAPGCIFNALSPANQVTRDLLLV